MIIIIISVNSKQVQKECKTWTIGWVGATDPLVIVQEIEI